MQVTSKFQQLGRVCACACVCAAAAAAVAVRSTPSCSCCITAAAASLLQVGEEAWGVRCPVASLAGDQVTAWECEE